MHSGRCQPVGPHDLFCLKRAPKSRSQAWGAGPLPPGVALWGHGRAWASAWVGRARFTDGPAAATPPAKAGQPPTGCYMGSWGLLRQRQGAVRRREDAESRSQALLPRMCTAVPEGAPAEGAPGNHPSAGQGRPVWQQLHIGEWMGKCPSPQSSCVQNVSAWVLGQLHVSSSSTMRP